MGEKFNVAVCQMRVGNHKIDNLQCAEKMIHESAQKGARIIILPEMFNVPYQTEIMAQQAEICPGETTAILSELASRNEIILVAGSIPEKDANGKIFNTSYTFDQQGSIIGKHRKIHLFDIDIPGSISFQESNVFSAGDNLQIIRHEDLIFAVIICYDIRFPELARIAALEGAQLLIVPAAFNDTTGPAHWELLMRTRAVDNQLFVIACSPALNPEAIYHAWGHSLVVDPWGRIISEGGIEEEIIEAELDFSIFDKVRRELPLLQHRRTDIYELSYQGNNQ